MYRKVVILHYLCRIYYQIDMTSENDSTEGVQVGAEANSAEAATDAAKDDSSNKVAGNLAILADPRVRNALESMFACIGFPAGYRPAPE